MRIAAKKSRCRGRQRVPTIRDANYVEEEPVLGKDSGFRRIRAYFVPETSRIVLYSRNLWDRTLFQKSLGSYSIPEISRILLYSRNLLMLHSIILVLNGREAVSKVIMLFSPG